MSTQLRDFCQFWRAQQTPFLEDLCDAIQREAGEGYAELPRDQVLAASARLIDAWYTSLETSDPTPIVTFGREIGLNRATAHLSIDEVMRTVDILRVYIWGLIEKYDAISSWTLPQIQQLEQWIHAYRNGVVGAYGVTLLQTEVDLAEREQILETQRRLIKELSTPIVPIFNSVLLLPLVGTVDAQRATRIMEAALVQIAQHQADVLIVDITGVSVVDTGVANHLIQMARAVMLLGAHVILVGIGAEIAQTIAHLEIDLGAMVTLANLQAALRYALEHQGLAVVRQSRIDEVKTAISR